MTWIDFRQLRALIDITQALAWMNWQPSHRRRKTFRGNCPLCENNSSHSTSSKPTDRHFVIALDLQRYKCHRCDKHGDVIDLWAAHRKLTLRAAAIELKKLLANPSPHQAIDKHDRTSH